MVRGLEIGFIRQFCSTFGFFLGLFIGAFIETKILQSAHSPETRAFVALIVTLASAFSVMGVGEYVGWLLKFKVSDSPLANKLDRYFGSALAAVTLLVGVWLAASIFRTLPNSSWQRQIQGSKVIAGLEHALPSAPGVLTKLGHLLDPNGFPQVFVGLERTPGKDAPLPDMGELNTAVKAARASVVKVEGAGCGGIVEGSGFVAAPDTVITNAHVVAGVKDPIIADGGGGHRARVVLFDKNLDVAVLRTSNLVGKPLPLSSKTMDAGTATALLGYPGGGEFTASGAAILEAFTARGRDIYNQNDTERRIYSLKGDVREGNSGGPIITKDGEVVGVIFAKSTTYDNLGYALIMEAVIRDLNQAGSKTVNTGSCTE